MSEVPGERPKPASPGPTPVPVGDRRPGRGRIALGLVVLVAAAAYGVFARFGEKPVLVVLEHDSSTQAAASLARDLASQITSTLSATFEDRLVVIGPVEAPVGSGSRGFQTARDSLDACLVVTGVVRAAESGQVVLVTDIVRAADRVSIWTEDDTTTVEAAILRALPRVVQGVGASLGSC